MKWIKWVLISIAIIAVLIWMTSNSSKQQNKSEQQRRKDLKVAPRPANLDINNPRVNTGKTYGPRTTGQQPLGDISRYR